MKRYVAGAFGAVVAVLVLAVCALPAGALVPNGDQGWYWQMPQPVGGQLAAVAFPTATNVWAVGGGRILHSTDAGATWLIQRSTPDTDLLSVAFAGDKEGIVCGDQGPSDAPAPLVLTTDDSGATWSDATPDAATGSLVSVSLGAAGQAWIGGTGGQLWTTADAGATWTRRAVGSYRGLVSTATAGGGAGWAGGSAGRIWRTVDGGATWSPQTTGLASRYQVGEIECTDAEHAWAVAYGVAGGQFTSRVLATSDGGTTWRVAFRSNTELVTGVHAVGPSDAWIVSSDLGGLFQSALGFGPLGSTSRLRHTDDGGATWATSTIHSSSAPYAVSGSGGSLCAVGSGILTSSDSGQTWLSQTAGGSYLFTAAQAVSSTDVWAVDLAGAVVHSSDGVRWQELAAPQRWSQTLDDVSFPDAANGWVVGATAGQNSRALILHTADGGATWTRQAAPLLDELGGVDFVDAMNGWVVSDSADSRGRALYRTSDGGATWVPQRPHAGIIGLDAVDFLDPTTGWVTGPYESGSAVSGLVPGAVFRTSDGGATWNTYPLPRNTMLYELQFLDEHDGWAIQEKFASHLFSRYVVHTSDAGKTWTRLAQFSGSRPTSVQFLDSQTGWVAVLGKGIYATSDGGTTWQREADSDATLAIAASDSAHVWAFGLGDLLGTVDSSADTAPPSTLSDGDGAWHDTSQTLTLTPNDIGAAGLAGTQYSLDRGKSWQDGTVIAFDAPADHANDGVHEVFYRSTDLAGNREATQLDAVSIDTLGPVCSAPKEAVVNAGSRGILRFMAVDTTSGVQRATITLSDRGGHVRRTFVSHAGHWGASPAPTYYWLRFDCDLKPGRYLVTVSAVDLAGNTQVKVGHNWLRVVRSGAPKATHPWWPSGLPGSSMSSIVVAGAASKALAAPLPSALAPTSLAARPALWLTPARSVPASRWGAPYLR
jgi:photosystem II stability/assembly factor-like uncharacterized protein